LSVFAIYPFMKRFTCLAHFGVGISLAMAPLAGWLVLFCFYNRLLPNEIIGSYDPTIPRMIGHSVLALPYLVLFTFFWVSGFDIIYSTMDEAFDRSQGLHSLPAKFGRKKALWISAFLHVLAFVTLMVLYVSYFRTPVAGVLLGATGVLLFLEQYLAENVDLAFFKINAIISFIVLAFIWSGVAHL
jgi:4-hydroxybenzoate polyprenyltransferase